MVLEKVNINKTQKAALLDTLHGDVATEEELDGYLDDPEYFGLSEGTTVREAILLALQPELIKTDEDGETTNE